MRLQFTLRSLLLATAAIALWLGWLSDRAARQRRAVQALEAHGGEVFYDDRLVEFPDSPSAWSQYNFATGRSWTHQHILQEADGYSYRDGSTEESAWDWLPAWVDEDYFRRLVGVKLDTEDATKDDLRALSRVDWIRWLLDAAKIAAIGILSNASIKRFSAGNVVNVDWCMRDFTARHDLGQLGAKLFGASIPKSWLRANGGIECLCHECLRPY